MFIITGKPQAKADCFTQGFAYGGEDILTAGWHNIQNSAEACQTSCQVKCQIEKLKAADCRHGCL